MSTAVTRPSPPPRSGGSPALTERIFRIRESGIIAVLLVFVAVTFAVQPRFLARANIRSC